MGWAGALVEAWCRVFRELPPDDDGSTEADAHASPEPELPPDDTMLRIKEVARQTGISESTIKRKVIAGDFPKPMRLSSHRIGWPARDVRRVRVRWPCAHATLCIYNAVTAVTLYK
jgi:prophage regulatory protein